MHVLKLKNIAFLAVVEIAKFSIFTPIILSLNVSASECFATGTEWFFAFHRVSTQLRFETKNLKKLAVRRGLARVSGMRSFHRNRDLNG